MVDIQNLQRQHQEISKLIGQLAAYDRKEVVEEKAFEISLLLGSLSGKIKLHLLADDRYVYPLLTAHSNMEIKAISQKFADEMGNLSAIFLQFQEKYANAAQIRALAPGFAAELKGIISAIQERIVREDKSLYPLLER